MWGWHSVGIVPGVISDCCQTVSFVPTWMTTFVSKEYLASRPGSLDTMSVTLALGKQTVMHYFDFTSVIMELPINSIAGRLEDQGDHGGATARSVAWELHGAHGCGGACLLSGLASRCWLYGRLYSLSTESRPVQEEEDEESRKAADILVQSGCWIQLNFWWRCCVITLTSYYYHLRRRARWCLGLSSYFGPSLVRFDHDCRARGSLRVRSSGFWPKPGNDGVKLTIGVCSGGTGSNYRVKKLGKIKTFVKKW